MTPANKIERLDPPAPPRYLVSAAQYEALTELATAARAIADEGFTVTENDRNLADAIRKLDAIEGEAVEEL